MKKLWEKNWKLDEAIEVFETKDDLVLDERLVPFDVYCSLAHVKMLNKIGIISEKELEIIKKGLLEVLELRKSGKFPLVEGDEDIHTKIENFITDKYGEAGKKIHTGRSRNDQVLTDIRLYTKSSLLDAWKETVSLTGEFYKFAKKYEFVPMPGYTHTQKAMPSSVGMWASAFVEALLDDLILIKSAYFLNDQSPLGSAAAYGVPINLDREYAADLMGFGSIQKNSLYAQNSRGKIESAVIAALSTVLLDINRFATDVLLFSSAEFGYFGVEEKLSSGSSIMPQKKNIDIAELLRSKSHVMLGYYVASASLPSNLISGYNRDLQDSKRPLFESLSTSIDTIKVASVLINNISPDKEEMLAGLTPEIFAAHSTFKLVAGGMAFRDAYNEVGKNPENYKINEDIEMLLKKSTHIGGTGNLGLDTYIAQINNEKKEFEEEHDRFSSAIKSLLNS